jgi:hypothetical protein
MNYVYILQSFGHPEQFYTGLCKDVDFSSVTGTCLSPAAGVGLLPCLRNVPRLYQPQVSTAKRLPPPGGKS